MITATTQNAIPLRDPDTGMRRPGSVVRSRPRVLVCEDDAVTLLQLRATFKSLGCEVETAALGSAAFYKLQTETFDLVLMDYQLPLKRADETLGEMLPWERISTPFILMSVEDHRREADEFGFMAFYPKPITLDTAKKLLQRFVVGDLRGALTGPQQFRPAAPARGAAPRPEPVAMALSARGEAACRFNGAGVIRGGLRLAG